MLTNYDKLPSGELRIKKTQMVLLSSLSTVLEVCRFGKLTVDRLCKEARISRATFYSHFTDKYHVLEFWMHSSMPFFLDDSSTYDEVRATVNNFIYENRKMVKNLLIEADQQTLDIICDFLVDALGIKVVSEGDIQKDAVSSNILAGGVICYLLWQVRHNFPSDVPVINEHSYAALKQMRKWARG